MPDRSSWPFLTLIVSIYFIIAFLESFTESYIATLNEKKLEKDDENNELKASKFEKLLKKKQIIISSLSCVKVFISIIYGFTVSVMMYEYLAHTFSTMLGSRTNYTVSLLLSALCCTAISGLIYYFLCIVLPDRLGFRAAHNGRNPYRYYGLIAFVSNISIIISFPFRGFSSLFFFVESIVYYIF